MYSADNAATKYSPLDQINRANVGTLKVAWRRSQTPPDIPCRLRFAPTTISVRLPSWWMACSTPRTASASPRRSIRQRRDDLGTKAGDDPLRGSASLRGLAYWTDGKEHRIFSYRNQYLYALDARPARSSPPSVRAVASISRLASTRAPVAGAGMAHRSSSATSP
jgi:quinoprotein glucose dehydrogenase